MAKTAFCTFYTNRPPSKETVLDYETCLVDQSEADMVSLSSQLERYGMTGLLAKFEAVKDKFGYADTRLIPSYMELQNRIVEGRNYFMNLPSEIRAKFKHDPAIFYDYIENNPEKAQEDGYISKKKADEIVDYIKENQIKQKQAEVVEPAGEDVKNDSAI